jgi:ClpX C4-type zinc finger
MDDELLAEARRAQERLIDAERDVEVARAEFHRAVRRLHLHGASLRELAAGLGLSHQRVHQIVESAGGSRRWLRRRETGRPFPPPICTFCGKQQAEVGKVIAGPGAYICDECVGLAKSVISSGAAASTPRGQMIAVPEQDRREHCSFCGKYRYQAPGLAAFPAEVAGKPPAVAAICTECLDLCDEIIAEDFSAPRA